MTESPGHDFAHDVARKTPVFEKLSLPGGGAEIFRLTRAEALVADLGRALEPIDLQRVQRRRDQPIRDTAFAEFGAQAMRSVPSFAALPGVTLGVAYVALQALVGQFVEGRLDQTGGNPPSSELDTELTARMFAAREQADGRIANLRERRPVGGVSQPSNSSATPSSASSELDFAPATSNLARNAASICAAVSGLSFSHWRTLSLPWPMRSPL